MPSNDFFKEHDGDHIWWVKDPPIGEWLFSFDKQTIYNMFRDYPKNMTAAQIAIFDKENPYWANFFSDRRR